MATIEHNAAVLPEELTLILNNHVKNIVFKIANLNREIKALEDKRDFKLNLIKTLYSRLIVEINTCIETRRDIHIIIDGSCVADITKRSVKSWKKNNPELWIAVEYLLGILEHKGYTPSVGITDYTTGYCCGRTTYKGGKELIISCSVIDSIELI